MGVSLDLNKLSFERIENAIENFKRERNIDEQLRQTAVLYQQYATFSRDMLSRFYMPFNNDIMEMREKLNGMSREKLNGEGRELLNEYHARLARGLFLGMELRKVVPLDEEERKKYEKKFTDFREEWAKNPNALEAWTLWLRQLAETIQYYNLIYRNFPALEIEGLAAFRPIIQNGNVTGFARIFEPNTPSIVVNPDGSFSCKREDDQTIRALIQLSLLKSGKLNVYGSKTFMERVMQNAIDMNCWQAIVNEDLKPAVLERVSRRLDFNERFRTLLGAEDTPLGNAAAKEAAAEAFLRDSTLTLRFMAENTKEFGAAEVLNNLAKRQESALRRVEQERGFLRATEVLRNEGAPTPDELIAECRRTLKDLNLDVTFWEKNAAAGAALLGFTRKDEGIYSERALTPLMERFGVLNERELVLNLQRFSDGLTKQFAEYPFMDAAMAENRDALREMYDKTAALLGREFSRLRHDSEAKITLTPAQRMSLAELAYQAEPSLLDAPEMHRRMLRDIDAMADGLLRDDARNALADFEKTLNRHQPTPLTPLLDSFQAGSESQLLRRLESLSAKVEKFDDHAFADAAMAENRDGLRKICDDVKQVLDGQFQNLTPEQRAGLIALADRPEASLLAAPDMFRRMMDDMEQTAATEDLKKEARETLETFNGELFRPTDRKASEPPVFVCEAIPQPNFPPDSDIELDGVRYHLSHHDGDGQFALTLMRELENGRYLPVARLLQEKKNPSDDPDEEKDIKAQVQILMESTAGVHAVQRWLEQPDMGAQTKLSPLSNANSMLNDMFGNAVLSETPRLKEKTAALVPENELPAAMSVPTEEDRFKDSLRLLFNNGSLFSTQLEKELLEKIMEFPFNRLDAAARATLGELYADTDFQYAEKVKKKIAACVPAALKTKDIYTADDIDDICRNLQEHFDAALKQVQEECGCILLSPGAEEAGEPAPQPAPGTPSSKPRTPSASVEENAPVTSSKQTPAPDSSDEGQNFSM